MKKVYRIGDDLFMSIAFVVFIVGVVLKLLGISTIIWGITPIQLFNGAAVCLLFSIALSLREMAHSERR